MKQCNFKIDGNKAVCDNCGLVAKYRGKPILHECKPQVPIISFALPEVKVKHWAALSDVPLACVHRGEQVREIGCQTCGGRTTMISVYACEIHGECLLRRSKAGDDLKCCLSCGERVTSDA